MLLYENGSVDNDLTAEDLKAGLYEALGKLGQRNKVLAIPPDYTRLPSRAGELTEFTWQYYGEHLTDVLPALGTHTPMTPHQIAHMFGSMPSSLIREHDWRNDVVTVGVVPAEYVKEVSEGAVDFEWPAQVNKLLVDGQFDLILSIGQVVPHEVVGMANYNKNIFVGTGGVEGINKSHFIGAAYGMERMMGHADTPVRRIFNYASEHFIKDMPIVYVQTVVGLDKTDGKIKTRGLFIGSDFEVFDKAAKLALQTNFDMLDKPLKKVVVYLDPTEFKSTWLGNKSIYRTRMAIEDNGELIVLAPALKEFGEDKEIDRLIRKYGYYGTPATLKACKENEELQNNLSAAAHLIHGSSESRFSITYCSGNNLNLTREEIESVGFKYAMLDEVIKRYDPAKLKDGYNLLPDGEEIYYISNPALGLWAYKERFKH
jgi:nickel-dependent lactate racemase